MTLLISSVIIVLVVSALCSLSEAALYAVRMPYIRQLELSGSLAGKTLAGFKENMERPISAVLIINTVANTAGAAVAGAQAMHLFGPQSLWWFSIIFTVAVLFMSEIMPKVVGVVHNRSISRLICLPLSVIIAILLPLLVVIQSVSRMLRPKGEDRSAPEEELKQMAAISAEEGSIFPYEAELVKNALRLDQVTAREIMTPRSVVYTLSAKTELRVASEQAAKSPYSRIPVSAADSPEKWVGVVMKQDILARSANDEFDVALQSLCHPISLVSHTTPGHVLLKAFVKRRSHLFGVADEYGSLVGIVTLEDVVESIIGEEIVDETDEAADMQEVARQRSDLPTDDPTETRE